MFEKLTDKKDLKLKWLFLLMKVNQLNRSVKENGWSYQDKQAVYDIKDRLMEKILKEKPAEIEMRLFFVPYYKYSMYSKDKAGELMRRDGNKYPFEYYLGQIEPEKEDIEIPDKATIEIEISCMNQTFSFHQPLPWIEQIGIDTTNIPKKTWMNAETFHHTMLETMKTEIEGLFAELE